MPKSTFGRFKDGVQISGVSMNVHEKGQVLYVCNASTTAKYGIAGADDSDGLTPEHPLATITQALSLSSAGRGDKIVVLPGHAETVSAAAGMDLNVAGVDIIGVGTGSKRPTITLDTANTATVQISASDVSVNNVLFVANFLNIATCIKCKNATVAKDAQIINCEFRDTDATHNFVKAISTSTTDNQNDGLTVKGCRMNGTGTSAATTLINVLGATDRLTVEDNDVFIQGTTATTGALVLATSKALTTASIQRNNASSPLTTSAAGGLVVAGSGGSGLVADNYLYIPAAATGILITTGTGLGFKNNYVSRSAVDTSGLLLPAAST